MILKLIASLPTQSLNLDLSSYINVQKGEGMDPYDPKFREAVISHSLLKEGGVLALQNLKAKELMFPLRLKAQSSSETSALLIQIEQALSTPGCICSWQDDGMSQPTYFDTLTGQFDVEYNYRETGQHFLSGKLRVFTQPLGRTAGPRPYAAASGVGPLLMISPYASGGTLAISPSTQAGFAGWGGKQQPSGGVFFQGSPSLAGDAPALLQVSYTGPLPNTATNAGTVPYVAVAVLPDQNYAPLIRASQVDVPFGGYGPSPYSNAKAVASTYWTVNGNGGAEPYGFNVPATVIASGVPPLSWVGNHRLFGIMRASAHPGAIRVEAGQLVSTVTSATVNTGDWGLYDLGTFAIRASEPPLQGLFFTITPATGPAAVDITAFVMLPDANTHYLNPKAINAAQYGWPLGNAFNNAATAAYTNTILLDDTLPDQFIYLGASQAGAPSALGMAASSSRITQYTRGLLSRPNPHAGLPILAVLGVGQNSTPSTGVYFGGASWTNPQNFQTTAQVNVLERTRYVLP